MRMFHLLLFAVISLGGAAFANLQPEEKPPDQVLGVCDGAGIVSPVTCEDCAPVEGGSFSEKISARALPRWLGVERAEGVELGRFVLLDDVEGNGESWFLARAFRLLREAKPEIRRVLSYSDPVERRDLMGRVTKPGHYGTIYQASNACFMGRSSSKREVLDAQGRVFSMRALSKIRNDERGGVSAQRRLIEAGAPPRGARESGRAYVERALREGGFTSVAHPGKLVYSFGLDRASRRALPPNPGEYPKANGGPS